jgi:hypothetical protein
MIKISPLRLLKNNYKDNWGKYRYLRYKVDLKG